MNKSDDELIDQYIDMAEDERTVMAKKGTNDARRVTIDAAHSVSNKRSPSILQ